MVKILTCSLALLSLIFCPDSVGARSLEPNELSRSFRVNIKLYTEDERPDGAKAVIFELINVSSQRRRIQPPSHRWSVNGKSCVTAFGAKIELPNGRYYVLEPGEKILQTIHISALSVPVYVRGGYSVYELPGNYEIQDTVGVCDRDLLGKDSSCEIKSNIVTCRVSYPPRVEQVYYKALGKLSPGWEMVSIKTMKGTLAQCFGIVSIYESMDKGEKPWSEPSIAYNCVYFVPLSMDIDLPSHLNGRNTHYTDFKDLGRTSEYRLYGTISNAGREVLEDFAENIRKALE